MSGVQISLPRPLYLLGLIEMKVLIAGFVFLLQPSHAFLAFIISMSHVIERLSGALLLSLLSLFLRFHRDANLTVFFFFYEFFFPMPRFFALR